MTTRHAEGRAATARHARTTLLGGVVVLAAACSPVYSPPIAFAPMLRRQGEIVGAVQVGSTGSDAKGAYALTNHYGLVAGVSYNNRDSRSFDKNATTYDDHSHLYGELASAVFGSTSEINRAGGHVVLEGLVGIGYGHSTGQIRNDDRTLAPVALGGSPFLTGVTGSYFSPFLQGELGVVIRHAEFAFTTRLVLVDYTLHSVDGYRSTEGRASLLCVPALIMRFGGDALKLETQLGGVATLADSSRPYSPSVPGTFVSIGAFARFQGG